MTESLEQDVYKWCILLSEMWLVYTMKRRKIQEFFWKYFMRLSLGSCERHVHMCIHGILLSAVSWCKALSITLINITKTTKSKCILTYSTLQVCYDTWLTVSLSLATGAGFKRSNTQTQQVRSLCHVWWTTALKPLF